MGRRPNVRFGRRVLPPARGALGWKPPRQRLASSWTAMLPVGRSAPQTAASESSSSSRSLGIARPALGFSGCGGNRYYHVNFLPQDRRLRDPSKDKFSPMYFFMRDANNRESSLK